MSSSRPRWVIKRHARRSWIRNLARSEHAPTRVTVARASVVRFGIRQIWSGSSRTGHSLTKFDGFQHSRPSKPSGPESLSPSALRPRGFGRPLPLLPERSGEPGLSPASGASISSKHVPLKSDGQLASGVGEQRLIVGQFGLVERRVMVSPSTLATNRTTVARRAVRT